MPESLESFEIGSHVVRSSHAEGSPAHAALLLRVGHELLPGLVGGVGAHGDHVGLHGDPGDHVEVGGTLGGAAEGGRQDEVGGDGEDGVSVSGLGSGVGHSHGTAAAALVHGHEGLGHIGFHEPGHVPDEDVAAAAGGSPDDPLDGLFGIGREGRFGPGKQSREERKNQKCCKSRFSHNNSSFKFVSLSPGAVNPEHAAMCSFPPPRQRNQALSVWSSKRCRGESGCIPRQRLHPFFRGLR